MNSTRILKSTRFISAALAFSIVALSLTAISARAQTMTPTSLTANSGTASFNRIDYYVAKKQEKLGYPRESVQRLSAAIFFIPLKPDANGDLPINTAPGSPFAAEVAGMKRALAPGAKYILGLGSLTAIVNKPAAQQKFLQNVQQICATYGFKGIDIDWEDFNNGGGVNHAPAYAEVVKAIASHFHPLGMTISVSFATWEGAYIPLARAVAGDIDFLNLQVYFSTNNAMPMPAFEKVLADYARTGIPARKIRVGLPTYGMVDPHKTKTRDKWRSWDQLLAAHVDVTHRNQWTDPANGQTYYFSGLDLLRQKIDYAKSHGFAGIFTWELSQDTHYNNPLSANRLIDETTLGAAKPR